MGNSTDERILWNPPLNSCMGASFSMRNLWANGLVGWGLAVEFLGERKDPMAVRPRVDRERKLRLDVGIAFVC